MISSDKSKASKRNGRAVNMLQQSWTPTSSIFSSSTSSSSRSSKKSSWKIKEISMIDFHKGDKLTKLIHECGKKEGVFLLTDMEFGLPVQDAITLFEFAQPSANSDAEISSGNYDHSIDGNDGYFEIDEDDDDDNEKDDKSMEYTTLRTSLSKISHPSAMRLHEKLSTRNDKSIKHSTDISDCIWAVDAAREGGRSNADEKVVISVINNRLKQHLENPHTYIDYEYKHALKSISSFFESSATTLIPHLVRHISTAIGDPAPLYESDYHYSYRLADYYSRPINSSAPRCGEHRDFGLVSLVFQDGKVDGLEVRVGKRWYKIPPRPRTCVVMFGYCAAWRSNNRIRACRHRVVDPDMKVQRDTIPRRLSSVVSVGMSSQAVLSPTLLSPDEKPLYRTMTVGEVYPNTEILQAQGTAGKASLLKKGLLNPTRSESRDSSPAFPSFSPDYDVLSTSYGPTATAFATESEAYATSFPNTNRTSYIPISSIHKIENNFNQEIKNEPRSSDLFVAKTCKSFLRGLLKVVKSSKS